MIINGKNYPLIGFIRAKPISDQPGRWTLSIYPPAESGVLFIIDEPGAVPFKASWAEAEVSGEEVKRIICVAPHLIPGSAYDHRPDLRGR